MKRNNAPQPPLLLCTPEEHILIMRDHVSELNKHADALREDNWDVSFIVGHGIQWPTETTFHCEQLKDVCAKRTVKL